MLQSYPIWLHREAVGWHDRTPVVIRARLPGQVAGRLRLRTAKGTYAGVWPPIRVDLYRRSDSGFRHVGAYHGKRDALGDRMTHWIEVPVAVGGEDARIIVHAQSTNIFVDEIEWLSGEIPIGEEQSVVGSRQALITDNTDRLKAAYLDADAPVPETVESWSMLNDQLYVWNTDTWGRIESFPGAKEVTSCIDGASMVGTVGERETLCLGFFHPTRETSYEVVVDGTSEGVTFRVVATVLASNGAVVHDPFVPLKDGIIQVNRARQPICGLRSTWPDSAPGPMIWPSP